MSIQVTIWNEFRHEIINPAVRELYPSGMHNAIAAHLRKLPDWRVRTATLDDPDHGLSDDVLETTDVMTWWGHLAHDEVRDDIVRKVHQRVLNGMGLIVLHSGHLSKIFRRLMGTTCELKWRDDGERETLWVTRPGHPIVRGVEDHLVLPKEEMYGEFFDIPEPQETLMISTFEGGEAFRSLCTWTRGAGRIVYFRPGHELFPTYHNPDIIRIIQNAILWAAPTYSAATSFGRKEIGWVEAMQNETEGAIV